MLASAWQNNFGQDISWLWWPEAGLTLLVRCEGFSLRQAPGKACCCDVWGGHAPELMELSSQLLVATHLTCIDERSADAGIYELASLTRERK